MNWKHDETRYRPLLILLEKVLSRLDKPVLLTDFLINSLNVGGAISLLALQGIFVVIQQHKSLISEYIKEAARSGNYPHLVQGPLFVSY